MEVFQLNNQEPKSRVQRYNFNQDPNRPMRQRPRKPRRWWPWVMTLLTLAIAILLVLGITHHNNSASNTVSSSSNSASLVAKASSVSEQSAYESFKDKYDGYNDNGLTVSQKQKLQNVINDESNSAVQAREQKLLNQAQTKSSNASNTSTSSSSASNQNPTSFDSVHTFSSVADAQSWAQASKNQWLQAGYTTYTITSDGQGNYNLQFVR
ncbi:hypothetical protein FD07_GL000755 [Levilactobacillus parabrevis ATCC 53295]|uniref:Uncharacterized protein n=1 Tax=Levilactobacillus parabrevis ATCC 53295 TaxID=1267003 RepID=A0A0R1GYX0_9LACO|nr:hypothetical protein FD07_GL000755 [Levilactobacillus parabrevis ATCC 53295]KRO06926.1 hypothetical protein IV61_GL001696 [Levilactobacillus parabrevis]